MIRALFFLVCLAPSLPFIAIWLSHHCYQSDEPYVRNFNFDNEENVDV